MSNELDKQVVKLELDNSNFEKNAKESMKTLDKFEKKLSFEDVSDSIKHVEHQFSKFSIVAITAISNITNRIVNLGIQMVKSLSTDNIVVGWDKFGKKTQSVATIAAQTLKIAGREITNVSEKMELINEQLEKLNWFTDETSYNFTDMVDNIGKFTAAGQDLDKAVEAMMGIANWAALSGQNASVASRAMYQLAQALSKGYVGLIDYKSIQNANMDTQEFRQTVLETAVALGELTESGDNFITKTGKKFTKNQFAEFLSDKWFTSDVLVKSLGKYSAAVDEIFKISEETGLTASEVMARYSSTLDEFGLKAFKAAQEARTFSDVLNSVKDAVSTGWMKIAENFFGGYDESVKLWTNLANRLYDSFTAMTNTLEQVTKLTGKVARGNIFGGFETEDQGAFWNILDSVKAVKEVVQKEWNSIFASSEFTDQDEKIKDMSESYSDLTYKLKDSSRAILEYIQNTSTLGTIFNSVFSALAVAISIVESAVYALDPVIYEITSLITNLYDKISSIASKTTIFERVLNGIINISNDINEILTNILVLINPSGVLSKFYNFIGKLLEALNETKPLEKIYDFITKIYESIENNLAVNGKFEKVLENLSKTFTFLGNVILKVVSILNKYLFPAIYKIMDITNSVVDALVETITDLVNVILSLPEKLGEVGGLSNVAGDVVKAFTPLKRSAKFIGEEFLSLSDVFKDFGNNMLNALKAIPSGINKIVELLTGSSIKNKLSKQLNDIVKPIEDFSKDLESIDTLKQSKNPLVIFITGIVNLFIGINDVLVSAFSIIGKTLTTIGNFLSKVSEIIKNMFSSFNGFMDETGKILSKLSVYVVVAISLYAIIKTIYWIFEGIRAMVSSFSIVAESLSDLTYGLYKKFSLSGLSDILNAIGKTILNISVSFALVTVMIASYEDDWWKSVIAIGSITLIISGLIIALTAIQNSVRKLQKVEKSLNLKSAFSNVLDSLSNTILSFGNLSTFYGISSVVRSIGISMIGIALSFVILSQIPTDAIETGIKVFSVYGAVLVASLLVMSIMIKRVEASGKKVKVKAINNIGLSFAGISVALLALTNSLQKLNDTFKQIKDELGKDDGDPTQRLLILAGTMAGLLAVLTIFTGLMNRVSGQSKQFGKYSGISIELTSIAITLYAVIGALALLNKLGSGEQAALLERSMEYFSRIMFTLAATVALINVSTEIFKSISVSMDKFSKNGEKTKNSVSLFKGSVSVILSLIIGLYAVIGALYLINNILSTFTMEDFQRDIGIIGGIFGFISVLYLTIEKNSKDLKTSLGTSAVLISIVISLYAFIGAIALLGEMLKSNLAVMLGGTILLTALVAIAAGVIAGYSILDKIVKDVTESKGLESSGKDFIKIVVVLISTIVLLATFIGALALLSKMSEGTNLWPAIAILGTLVGGIVALFALMKVVNMIPSKNGIGQIIASLVTTVGSLLALVPMIVILGDQDTNTLVQGGIVAGAIAASVLAIYLLTTAISAFGEKIKGKSTSIIAPIASFVASLIAVSVTISILGGMSTNELIKGGIVSTIIGSVLLLMIRSLTGIIDKSSPITSNSKSIIAIAIALVGGLMAMVGAIALIGGLDMAILGKGYLTITVISALLIGIMSMIGLISRYVKSTGTKISEIMSLVLPLFIGLGVMLIAIAALQDVDIGSIIAISVSLSAVMLALAGAIAIISKSFGKNKIENSKLAITMMSLMLGSLISMIIGLAILKDISVEQILIPLLGILGAIGLMVGVMTLLSNSKVNMESSYVLMAISRALILFGLAFIGLSHIPFGQTAIGLLLAIGALTALSVVALLIQKMNIGSALLSIGAAMLVFALAGGMMATTMEMLGSKSSDFFKSIVNNADDIGDAFRALLKQFEKSIPNLLSIFKTCIIGILGMIKETVPVAVDTLFSIILDFLTKLNTNLPKILEQVGGIIMTILDFLVSMSDAFGGKLLQLFAKMFLFVADHLNVLIDLLVYGLLKLIQAALRTISDFLLGWLDDIFGTHIVDSVDDFISDINDKILGNDLKNDVEQLGKDAATAFKDGMDDFLGINSPSTKMMETGEYIMEGLEIGIGDTPNEIGENIGESLSNGIDDTVSSQTFRSNISGAVNDALADVQNIIDSDIDDNAIVLRPVLDLTNVRQGVSSLSALMTGVGSTSVSTDMAVSASKEVKGSSNDSDKNKNQNGTSTITNEGDNYNVTFNVTSDDPEEIAKQVDVELQKMRMKKRYAKGGA